MNEPQTKQVISLKQIGVVQASDQEGIYALRIQPQYTQALKELDQFSHVMVILWADRHDNSADRQILTTELPYAPGVKAGVFACRSEYRPNPIGITIMPILSVDEKEGLVVLPWIDALNGTPILDLKPYMPVSDRIREVKVADWISDWPVWMEDAGAYFASHETNFGS